MFRQLVLALIAFVVFILIIMWVIGGGPRRGYERVTSIDILPFSPQGETGFRLPWQPAVLFPTIDISQALQPGADDYSEYESQLAELTEEYERLNRETTQTRTFGTPSPYTGSVSIAHDTFGVRGDTAAEEYIQINVDYGASQAVDVTGWSLESALSGTKAYLPGIATSFMVGTTNAIGPAIIQPGGLVIVTTAHSPVGASFRENICSGYLGQFQEFAPQLGNDCPSPSSQLPLTQENLQRYGESCFDAIAYLSSCEFPQNVPDTVMPTCRAFLTDALSYNGCVNRNRTAQSFETNRWRMYLGGTSELWRNSHDAIRLLDREGKTVDVFIY